MAKKDIKWIPGYDENEKKKYRVSIRMIRNSSLSGHADMIMSHKYHDQCEHPAEDMAKVIDGRETVDVLDEKFLHLSF